MLILDHQESYRAWIAFGSSIFLTVHLWVFSPALFGEWYNPFLLAAKETLIGTNNNMKQYFFFLISLSDLSTKGYVIMQFCPTFYYLDTLYLMSCRSCYCTFLKLNLRYAPIPRVFHNASSNVLFTWLNHLPDFLCCDTLPLKRNLRIPSYLTLPTVPASRLPTGELKVADVVFGRGEEGVFCLYLCERGDESVFFWTVPFSHARFCMFARERVNVRDRCRLLCQGWGHTFPPQPRCLQRFVSSQQTVSTGALTPSPLEIISLYTNSRPQDSLGKWGGHEQTLSVCF